MSNIEKFHVPEMGSGRNFGFVFAVVFVIVGVWPPVFGSGDLHWWSLLVAGGFAATAIATPKFLTWPNKLWFKFGMLLGRVVASFVMMLVFFVVVTPTSLLARIVGKDFLRIRAREKDKASFWVPHENGRGHLHDMSNQF